MEQARIAKLKDAALSALASGQLQKALGSYRQLEELDPSNPQWPKGTAVVLHKLGNTPEATDALFRAARVLAQTGEILKAAATCKQVLSVDSGHAATLRLVQDLRAAFKAAPKTADTVPTAPMARGSSWEQRDTGLEALSLREVVPGAAPVLGRAEKDGVYQIPLEPESARTAPLELQGGDPTGAIDMSELMLDHHGNVRKPPAEETAPSIEDTLVLAVEQEVRAAEKTDAALKATPLFSELSEESFGNLIMYAELVELEKDQELFRQGDPGSALYVVAEGTVGVVDEGPPRRGITKLKEGDFFGEVALITDEPRSATILALEDTQLISIDRQVMRKLIAHDPPVLTVLLRFVRDRMVDRLLAHNPLFTVLSSRDRDALRPRFRFLELAEGAVLIEQGKRSTGLQVLLAGAAEIVRSQDGKSVPLGAMRPGEVCGELSLLTGEPAIATVRVTRKSFAIELEAAAFLKIIEARPQAKAFIQQVAETRRAQSEAILSGTTHYAEGRLAVY